MNIVHSNKTLFQELVEENTSIPVQCQTDQAYSSAANQCSWCSTQFVLNRKDLIAAYFGDKAKFVEIYNNCIAVGTQLRNTYGEIPCGENADNQKMLNLTLNFIQLTKQTYSENQQIFEGIRSFIPVFALKQFNERKHTVLAELKLPKDCNFIMLGRHGQTFTVFPIENKYLVLDSHVHWAGVMTEKNLISYVKLQSEKAPSKGYVFVTIVAGNI